MLTLVCKKADWTDQHIDAIVFFQNTTYVDDSITKNKSETYR